MERMRRIELPLSVWKTEVLPLNDIRIVFPRGLNLVPVLLHSAALPDELENQVGKQGLEPRLPVPETGALTLTPHPESGDGRNRTGCGNACRARPLLSCHPHRQASAQPLRPAVMVLTLWTCQKPSLYERLAGTAGVEPAFFRFWGPAAYPLAHP